MNETKKKLGGRPKGSTVASSLDEKKRLEEAMADAVEEYREAIKKVKNEKERLRKGELTKIISKCREKHNLCHSILIKEETIRKRVQRNSKGSHQGLKSPLLSIEPYVVSLILQLAKMRIPLTTEQGLQLCNSIISGTKYEKLTSEFKDKYLRSSTKKLGHGYWRGFMKRNKHLISAKRAVKFDTKRSEWCTYQNLEEMYEEVYANLVEGGLAVKHDEAVWRNAAGEIITDESEACGLKSCYELIHPSWLVFVDEVGSNTSQAKDGAVGGQTYLCSKDGRPQQRAATKDAHFTVLGFTAATGEPLMCAIIFSGKQMKDEWRLGFDPFVQWIGDENNVSGNIGKGKAMPEGPECTFNGKVLPCFCCCSENGSITGPLLMNMLQAIDEMHVFDRADTGLNPFLLLNGHGSRFDLGFLEYINDSDTKWNCCIGLPYGTSYWQVGDSSEQNGCFKMALTKAKQELVTKKNDSGLEFAINKTDIVGLVSTAWAASFARADKNVNAITSRGWGPRLLAYNALLHPEILTSNGTSSGGIPEPLTGLQSSVNPEELNLSDGLAATLVEKIVLHKNRESQLTGADAAETRRKRKATAEERLH